MYANSFCSEKLYIFLYKNICWQDLVRGDVFQIYQVISVALHAQKGLYHNNLQRNDKRQDPAHAIHYLTSFRIVFLSRTH